MNEVMNCPDPSQSFQAQTSQLQIEVTPEMEDAGFRVLEASGIADEYLEADKLLLVEIYRAMFASAPGLRRAPSPHEKED